MSRTKSTATHLYLQTIMKLTHRVPQNFKSEKKNTWKQLLTDNTFSLISIGEEIFEFSLKN